MATTAPANTTDPVGVHHPPQPTAGAGLATTSAAAKDTGAPYTPTGALASAALRRHTMSQGLRAARLAFAIAALISLGVSATHYHWLYVVSIAQIVVDLFFLIAGNLAAVKGRVPRIHIVAIVVDFVFTVGWLVASVGIVGWSRYCNDWNATFGYPYNCGAAISASVFTILNTVVSFFLLLVDLLPLFTGFPAGAFFSSYDGTTYPSSRGNQLGTGAGNYVQAPYQQPAVQQTANGYDNQASYRTAPTAQMV